MACGRNVRYFISLMACGRNMRYFISLIAGRRDPADRAGLDKALVGEDLASEREKEREMFTHQTQKKSKSTVRIFGDTLLWKLRQNSQTRPDRLIA